MQRTCSNVNDGEADQMGKRIKNSTLLRSIRPPTNYNNTITLAFQCILLVIFLLLFLDFGIYSFRRSPLFYLSLRRLYFRFFDYFEDFLRIKDKLPFNSHTLSILTQRWAQYIVWTVLITH
jgi:hypothetical protein